MSTEKNVSNTSNEKLLIDVGSTYFKLSTTAHIEQHLRDFNKDILDDLMHKCGKTIEGYNKDDVHQLTVA
mgnify:FL=1